MPFLFQQTDYLTIAVGVAIMSAPEGKTAALAALAASGGGAIAVAGRGATTRFIAETRLLAETIMRLSFAALSLGETMTAIRGCMATCARLVTARAGWL